MCPMYPSLGVALSQPAGRKAAAGLPGATGRREAVYGHDVAGRVCRVTVEEVVGCGGVVCVQVA